MKKFYFCLLLSLLVANLNLLAQHGTVASGADGTGAGGTINFSVGQLDYITATGAGGSASLGNQQTYLISSPSGFSENSIQLEYIVYPNPTTDNLTLKISSEENRKLHFTLMSLDGKLILEDEIRQTTTLIPMTGLAKGEYLVNVSSDSKLIKPFKIIKN